MSPPFQPPATPPALAFLTEAERGTIENRLLMLGTEVSNQRADSERRAINYGEQFAKLFDGQKQILEGQRAAARDASRVRGVFAQTATFFLEKLGVL